MYAALRCQNSQYMWVALVSENVHIQPETYVADHFSNLQVQRDSEAL